MEKLYSVKEIAELTGLTKAGIQKVINKEPVIKFTEEKNKKRFYSVEKTKEIIERTTVQFDFALLELPTDDNLEAPTDNLTPPTNDEKSQQAEKTANQTPPTDENNSQQPQTTENIPTERELDLLLKKIEDLEADKEDLKKDKETLLNQLEMKDKQIQDYAERLKEALALTRGQQYIAAADKTKEIIDIQQNTDGSEAEPQQKQGFWSRLFKR